MSAISPKIKQDIMQEVDAFYQSVNSTYKCIVISTHMMMIQAAMRLGIDKAQNIEEIEVAIRVFELAVILLVPIHETELDISWKSLPLQEGPSREGIRSLSERFKKINTAIERKEIPVSELTGAFKYDRQLFERLTKVFGREVLKHADQSVREKFPYKP